MHPGQSTSSHHGQVQPASCPAHPAFSLLEMVTVVLIIGVVAAIAVPRFTNAADNARNSALREDLVVMREAIELYYIDHGAYPSGTGAVVATQLTTEIGGFGPYVSEIPPAPVGINHGETSIGISFLPQPALPLGSGGWVYHAATGNIWLWDPAYASL